MSKNATETMSDAEWEAKFNGPRDRLLKKIFGDSKKTAEAGAKNATNSSASKEQ